MTDRQTNSAAPETDRLAAQRHAASLHRQVLDSATGYAIISTDLAGLVTSWNAGARHLLGWSEADMLGQPVSRFFTPEDVLAGQPRTEMRVALEAGCCVDERWICRRDGTRFWASGQLTPLLDDTGRATGFVKVLHDQTERHHAEQALRAREAEMRLVADSLPVLIAFIDRHLIFRFANRAYEDWFYVRSADVVGRRAVDILGAEGLDDRREAIAQALAGQPVQFEAPWPHRDGRERIADIRYLPRRNKRGDVDGYYVFVTDVTERKHAERVLHAAADTLGREVQLRTRERDQIWRNSRDLLAVLDHRGVLLAANPAWTLILGWKYSELVGQAFDFIGHPDDVAPTAAKVAELAEGPLKLPFENRFRTKSGEYRWFAWTAVKEGSTIYAYGRDVTDEKQAAQALAEAQERLRQSQKMEAVGQLTGGLAHDFNNLLAGITGSLELLQLRIEQGRSDEAARYIEGAMASAQRAAALTHRLLAFSRRQTLDPRPTDVGALVSSMVELIQRTAGPGIQVETALAEGLWQTLCDPNQLENALLNLAINARDAMPDGGRLILSAVNLHIDKTSPAQRNVDPGEYVAISVTDTGTGMAADVVARAFDPFYTTKPIGEGTGLGLSMTYGFVTQSDGHIRIESALGRGTTVCLYLPRHEAGKDEAHGAAAEAREPAQGGTGGAGQTVLVVDDEPVVRMLVTEVLAELGYTTLEAADGAEGLALLRSARRIDLLVTDVGLPGGLNGRQMVDAARIARPELKVLFITGYAENAVLGNRLLSADMQVMVKPFAIDALAAKVGAMLGRTR